MPENPDEPTDQPADQPGEQPARSSFVPTVGVGLVASAVVAVAGNQPFAESSGDEVGEGVATVAAAVESATAPLATALALVVLAAWGVVLVTRGGFRRVVMIGGAVMALVMLAAVLAAWIAAPGVVEEAFEPYGLSEVGVRRTVWCWAAVVAAAVAFGAGVVGVRSVRTWPEMGRRYDAPGASGASGGAPTATAEPPEERTHLDLWKSMDDGQDPTVTGERPADPSNPDP